MKIFILTIFIFLTVFLQASAIRHRRFINIPGMSDNLDNFGVRSSEDCLLPKVVGTCRALIPAFYYNSSEKKCMPFSYGGCQGNANNFDTIEECQQTCEASLVGSLARLLAYLI